jgi:WD40 repeat protein
MTDDTWTVAIHATADDWKPLGAGVLIDSHRVLTCAHVVGTNESIWVAFPKSEGEAIRRRVTAVVRAEGPPPAIADVAVLRLEAAAPPDAIPAPLRDPPGPALVGRDWWAFGFPKNDDLGLGSAAQGRVDATLAYGWLRLRTRSDYRVEQGFSGAGLWSPAYQAVVGLVGQARLAGEHAGDGRALTLRQIAAWLPRQGLSGLAGWSAEASEEAALAAWGWRLTDDPEAGRHWKPRARGVTIDSERGFRFRGRTAALTAVVDWLRQEVPDRQALVVTGSPGVGKSAVLGRVVTTADAGIRAALPPGDDAEKAPIGSIGSAVHAKGKTALEVAVEIAKAASVALPSVVEDLAPALQGRLEDRPARFNVVIDALDEASTPAQARLIVTGIVLPLVQTCSSAGVQVVIGSRPRDDGGDLLTAFGGAARLLDLDRPEYFAEEDLVGYAFATLQLAGDEHPANPYADEDVALPVARRIARLAEGNFLVAGLVARTRGLHDRVPVAPGDLAFAPSVESALKLYLDRLAPIRGVPAADLLTVLAYAQAPGLPLDLWRSGLAALGFDLDEGDLRGFVRSAAANFLVETGRPGRAGTAYRLFHQALDDALRAARAETADPELDAAALTRRWFEDGRRDGWGVAFRGLPALAAVAGLVDELLADDEYLCHADLLRLVPHLDSVATGQGRLRARLLRLTPHAAGAEPIERASMFNLTSVMEKIDPVFPAGDAARYRAIWSQTTPRAERSTLSGHSGGVNDLCVTIGQDGQPLLASGSDDRTVRVWDLRTGQLWRTLAGHASGVKTLCAVSRPDGHLLAVAGTDGTVCLWDPESGRLRHRLEGHPNAVNALCAVAGPDGWELLASAGNDKTVRIWDPGTGESRHILAGHTRWVSALCAVALPDGRRLLASAGNDTTVRIWNPETGELLHTLAEHTSWVNTLCTVVRPDGRPLLASAGDDGLVLLWDPADGRLHTALTGHDTGVGQLCVVTDPAGRQLIASRSHGKAIRIWDPVAGRLQHLLAGSAFRSEVLCAVAGPDGGQLLAVAGARESVDLWDPGAGRVWRTLHGHTGRVKALCAVPGEDGQLLASAGVDQTVRLWHLGSDPEADRSGAAMHSVTGLVTLPGGGLPRLASAGGDGRVRTWDLETGDPGPVLVAHTMSVSALCTVGERLAIATADRTVRLWNPETGQLRHLLGTAAGHVTALSVIDADTVAVGNDVGKVTLRDAATGEWRGDVTNLPDGVNALCLISGRGGSRWLATAGADGLAQLRSLDPAGTWRLLEGHTGQVSAVCALDRHRLASAGEDGEVRIWDLEAVHPQHVLEGHTGWVRTLCVVTVADRLLLVSGGDDQTVRLWDPDDGKLLEVIDLHHPVRSCLAVGSTLAVGLIVGPLTLALRPNRG